MNLTKLAGDLEDRFQVHRKLDGSSDKELAEALVAGYRGLGCGLVATDRGVYCYDRDAGTWGPLADAYLRGAAMSMEGMWFEVLVRGEPAEKALRMSAARARAVVEVLRCLPGVYDPEVFQRAAPGIAFRNGFLSTAGGVARMGPHSPSNFARAAVPFDYDESAQCPLWLALLSEVFQGDPDAGEKITFLGEHIGASLLGHATKMQQCALLLGHGANGKSTVLDVVRELVPEDGRASLPPDDWRKTFRACLLDGKVLNLVDETPRERWETSETFKNVVTGGTLVGERKNKDAFTFRPTAGHIFAANELPSTADLSQGLWRRFVVVAFNRDFTSDPRRRTSAEILDQIRPELAGVAAWAVSLGLQAIARRKYTEPSSHLENLRDWQTQNDSVLAWFHETDAKVVEGWDDDPRFPRDKGYANSELWTKYRRWAERDNRKPVNAIKFALRLKKMKVPGAKQTNLKYWGLIASSSALKVV